MYVYIALVWNLYYVIFQLKSCFYIGKSDKIEKTNESTYNGRGRLYRRIPC